ncbi:MAG: hypothetical protein LC667_02880 [Thioalkalivibrio sp.]|nr:hypothetical protein [Thioalkalivibrio sp.]
MKNDRRAKGERVLRVTEASLRAALLEVLPAAALSGENLFMNSEFNPHELPAHLLSKTSEALLESSHACVEARVELRMPLDGSVGQLFLDLCAEAASADPHRRGPRKLAATLLVQLTDNEA